eukprot:4082723-Pleurochrysis_carterae.AAC.1
MAHSHANGHRFDHSSHPRADRGHSSIFPPSRSVPLNACVASPRTLMLEQRNITRHLLLGERSD